MKDDERELWRMAGRYMAVGIEMVVAVGIGVVAGRWLDDKFGTTPYLFWFGLVVGLGAATQTIIRVTRSASRDEDAP